MAFLTKLSKASSLTRACLSRCMSHVPENTVYGGPTPSNSHNRHWSRSFLQWTGMLQHPHHAKVTPKFCKQYARVGDVINKALSEYKEEVNNGSFPGPSHSPYKMNGSDVDGFYKELEKMGLNKAASAAAEKMSTAQGPVAEKSRK
ncbi:hypothetical protein V6N13_140193 [Hibiscus sabdariffa]|uniref:3-methyl-2-oxobutanoate hydroxymethyltransferase n=1 Tax=Hibiscus sabdariffa TaxID=183260 RepID=A0ABR2QB94_9ROSI